MYVVIQIMFVIIQSLDFCFEFCYTWLERWQTSHFFNGIQDVSVINQFARFGLTEPFVRCLQCLKCWRITTTFRTFGTTGKKRKIISCKTSHSCISGVGGLDLFSTWWVAQGTLRKQSSLYRRRKRQNAHAPRFEGGGAWACAAALRSAPQRCRQNSCLQAGQ